jgi:hypothetical protein
MKGLAGLLVGCLVTTASAQQTFDWYGRGRYRAAVPRPDSLLGHDGGTVQQRDPVRARTVARHSST